MVVTQAVVLVIEQLLPVEAAKQQRRLVVAPLRGEVEEEESLVVGDRRVPPVAHRYEAAVVEEPVAPAIHRTTSELEAQGGMSTPGRMVAVEPQAL